MDSGDTPHNFCLGEARGILYLVWYSWGLRSIDVGGEFRGPLETQGYEVGRIEYSDTTFSGAPQLHNGLWILGPEF